MIIENHAKSLEESVFSRLEDEILTGALKPGESLTELGLVSRLGVSRTPIRGALQRLADEGLVDTAVNKGAVVVGVSERDLIDIYSIRMRLEGLAASIAAERMTEEQIRRLEDSVELAEFYIRKADAEHLKELDSEFHNIIYEATGNRLLGKILSNLHKTIKRYRKLSLTAPGRLQSSVEEHREILCAIKARNSRLADELTSKHVASALENILSQLENNN